MGCRRCCDADLRTLSLRQNLLEDASSVGRLASAPILTELILQDNRLSTIPDLSALIALQRLEVSYNGIKTLAPLTSLEGANLSALFAASNKISSVSPAVRLAEGPALPTCSQAASTRSSAVKKWLPYSTPSDLEAAVRCGRQTASST